MTEATPEQIAMARRIASTTKVGASPQDILDGYWDNSPLVKAALAAIIETQRFDAELADEMRTKHSNPTGDEYTCGQWDQGIRIAVQIRAGKHYGKDQQ